MKYSNSSARENVKGCKERCRGDEWMKLEKSGEWGVWEWSKIETNEIVLKRPSSNNGWLMTVNDDEVHKRIEAMNPICKDSE